MKDIFDLSYLAEFVDCDTLAEYIREYIMEDPENAAMEKYSMAVGQVRQKIL